MLWSPNTQLLFPLENTALDYSGNARHGTVFGSGVYATKPNGGRCLYFDGTGDYVATPSFGLSGTVVVFAADVRCKYTASPDQTLIGDARPSAAGAIWLSRWGGGNNLYWAFYNGTGEGFSGATNIFAGAYDDTWIHVVVACDYSGKVCYFFRNGILFASPTLSGTPSFPSTARAKSIGALAAGDRILTNGYLANVQLWTLATMPAAGQMLANANRLMLGMNPIW